MAKQRTSINTETDIDNYMEGMFHANILIAEDMHETMKEIRHARRWFMRSDVRLCRLYQEAVEQYIDAKPQQQLLNEYRNRPRKSLVARPAVRRRARR